MSKIMQAVINLVGRSTLQSTAAAFFCMQTKLSLHVTCVPSSLAFGLYSTKLKKMEDRRTKRIVPPMSKLYMTDNNSNI
jgi:uncharacterized membrane protein YjjB (DUF3815 family)